eukprot:g2549.t1
MSDMCHGFTPGTEMSDDIGYVFAILAVVFFGTNFIPVKQYETGDGMFFQFVMCCGIWFVGLVVNFVRHTNDASPTFWPFATLGGFLWATGNVMCVPIIKTIGISMGLLIWGATNMMIGWATGSFGWFGLPRDCEACPTCAAGAQAPTCAIDHGRNYGGVAVALLALAFFVMVESDGAATRGDGDDEEDSLDVGDTATDGLLVGGIEAEAEGDENKEPPSWLEQLPKQQRRPVGIGMAVAAGLLFGSCFNPGTYIMKHNGAGQVYGERGAFRLANGTVALLPGGGAYAPAASGAGLDYVWAQFCGIFLTSLFWFIMYCVATGNRPRMYPRVVVPGFVSGVMWAIAQVSWFVANECLSYSVTFPLVTGGPGLIGAAVGVYFGEIKGRRNFALLGTSLVLTIIADALIASSRSDL